MASADFPRAEARVAAYRDGALNEEQRGVICERTLAIRVNGEPLVELLCSPVSLAELAYGFLYSERVIEKVTDVRGCVVDGDALTVSFDLAVPVERPSCPVVSSGFGGRVLGAPSCSGKAPRVDGCLSRDLSSEVDAVLAAMEVMEGCAREYGRTRGMHCSALFKDGCLLGLFEDIGRHNTFDKLVGHCLLNGIDPAGCLLTTTGRISGEMAAKAARLGVGVVASLSGPTDVAIARAAEAGFMLVGYAKRGGATVYAPGVRAQERRRSA